MYREALSGLAGHKSVAEHFELPRVLLAASAAESVTRRTDLDIDETNIAHHRFPAFTRKAASDSGSPEINNRESGFRHRLAIRDIREL